MPEELKIEAKTNMVKGFLTNPLSWLVGTITVGTFLFNLGGSSEKGKNDITGLTKGQTEMKADIKSLQTAVSLQNQEWTRFMQGYDADKKTDSTFKVKLYKGIIVLDTVMDRHLRQTNRIEERLQFWKDQSEKKNYSQDLIRQNMDIHLYTNK
jgi:hypothetical protein